MDKLIFKVATRQLNKKNKALRRQGTIPGNVIRSGKESIAIQFSLLDFEKLHKQAGETHVVYLELEDRKTNLPVLIDELQLSYVKQSLLHVVFKEVSLKEKVQVEIPLKFIGEIELPDLDLVTLRDNVMIEALPTELPEHLEVDISHFAQAGDEFLLKNVVFDKAKISLIASEEELNSPIIRLQEHIEEVVEEPVVTTEETTSPEASTETAAPTEAPTEPAKEKEDSNQKEDK